MKLPLLFASALIFASSSLVSAADKEGKFAIKGIGNTSCAQFLSETKANTKSVYLYVGWMNGYLTAQNQHMKNNFDLTSWENIHTLGDYLRNYCKSRPRDSFYIAAASMAQGLKKDRVETFSPTIKINENQEAIILYVSSLRKMQKKFKELGIYKGGIDGKYGKGTKTAVIKFQEMNKLEPTGIPDQRTLHAVFRKK